MVHKFRNQQRWLLFLFHARTCKKPGVKCVGRNCVTVQKLLSHMNSCIKPQCLYPRCGPTKSLVRHYKYCRDLRCPVCVPVNIHRQQQANVRAMSGLKLERSIVTKAGAVSGVPDHCADASDDLKLREDMRTFVQLQKRNPCPADAASKAKYLNVTRSLEEALCQMANTKEDYMNTTTLESRLGSLKLNDYNQNRDGRDSDVSMSVHP